MLHKLLVSHLKLVVGFDISGLEKPEFQVQLDLSHTNWGGLSLGLKPSEHSCLSLSACFASELSEQSELLIIQNRHCYTALNWSPIYLPCWFYKRDRCLSLPASLPIAGEGTGADGSVALSPEKPLEALEIKVRSLYFQHRPVLHPVTHYNME